MKTRMVMVLMTAAVLAIGCGREGANEQLAVESAGPSASGMIQIDGSSTVFPITEAVAEEFQIMNPDARVTVGISGTGGGFKKFCNGETDISDASRPIKPTELELCAGSGVEWIELPVAYDGIAVMVSPQNDWVDSMTVEELRKIWQPESQGKVMRWNQIRPEWPNEEMHLFGPGIDSGTFDYFTDAIVGEEGASRGDFTASEDDNVLVQGIANDRLALGFFGFAYYEENQDKLKIVPIEDGDESNGTGAIAPSVQTVADGTYQPLARPIFIYVRKNALDKKQVVAFVDFYLDNATELVREVGYIPLPQRAYELARERIAGRVTGSLFAGGSQIGVLIEDLLAAETSSSKSEASGDVE